MTSKSGVFSIGELYQDEHFNGDVYLNTLIDMSNPVPVCNVTFEPSCRNHWHIHQGGQILLVTSGKGYYQEWGKPAQILNPGDTVNIQGGVKHWHGASKNSWFAHIAIEVQPEKGAPTWLEAVSDEEYNKLK